MEFLTDQSTFQLNNATFGFLINLYWLILIGLMLNHIHTYLIIIWLRGERAVLR